MAQILTAYNLAVLTDLMGDVPWTEAIQPGVIFTPKLDSQESIYEAIFSFLDDAIANLGEESEFASIGDQDVLYGGDVDSWMKFAYGLKARYTMRLSHVTPDYNAVIEYADKSFSSAKEQAKYTSGEGAKSPFDAFFEDRDYLGASSSLNKKLTDRSDPRDTILFVPHPESGSSDIVLADQGTAGQVQGFYSVSGLSNITAPTYLLSYHEIEFLKAEAYVRLNNPDDAKTALENAVVAALGKVNVAVEEEDAVTYFEDVVESRFDSNPLEEVMVQKYIAFYEEEAIEAYNDIRRLKAMGDDVIELAHPDEEKFPLRFTYGSSDVTTNENVRDAYGNGSYVYSENVWWAGGSR